MVNCKQSAVILPYSGNKEYNVTSCYEQNRRHNLYFVVVVSQGNNTDNILKDRWCDYANSQKLLNIDNTGVFQIVEDIHGKCSCLEGMFEVKQSLKDENVLIWFDI